MGASQTSDYKENEKYAGVLFDAIDADKQGTLSENELRSFLWKHNRALPEADLRELMKQIDNQERDGEISRQEFTSLLSKPFPNPTNNFDVFRNFATTPHTAALTSFFCGTVVFWSKPGDLTVRKMNQVLFPAAGIILAMSAYEQAKTRLRLRNQRLGMLKEEVFAASEELNE